MSNVPAPSVGAQPPPHHPKLARLLKLRGWQPSQFEPHTQLETLLITSGHAKALLEGRVTLTEDLYRGWCVAGMPIGKDRTEAHEMLVWLGLGHLDAEWVPYREPSGDDTADVIREARYSHFPEHLLESAGA